MAAPLRFGILGTGNIARQFVGAMGTSSECVVTAVGSRKLESAEAFVTEHYPRLPRRPLATNYEELIASELVDAVYVSLPNSLHAEWTLRALEAGKHVLCEKPLAMNAAEGARMFAAARRANRLLVEAFMYVSHPLTKAYREVIASGTLGELRHVRTSFCYRTLKVAGNVRFEPELGGGSLMDIGCYCVNFSRMIARAVSPAGDGEPVRISAEGRMHASGVDEQVSALLAFPSGLTASFTCGMGVQADNTATVSGTEGYLEVPIPWKPPVTGARYVVGRSTPPKMDGGGGKPASPPPPPREEFVVDAGKDLYALEADDFARAVRGEIAPAVTEADTLGNLAVLDRIREMIRGGV